jgi:hypothetical protein
VWVLSTETDRSKAMAMTSSIPFAVVHFGRDGKPRDTLARYNCTRKALLSLGKDGGVTVCSLSMNDCEMTVSDSRGDHLYHLAGIAPRAPDSTAFTIIKWSPRSGMVWKKSFPFRPHPLTKSFLDTAEEPIMREATNNHVTPELHAPIRSAWEAIGNFPSVTDAVAGMDGTLLVRREADRSAATWMVLDAEGTMVGHFDLPLATVIVQATSSLLWAVEPDAEGQPHVVRYRMGK